MVNLTKLDEYENGLIPDADVETCLKVIRTLRNVCLMPNVFDADAAVVLSHAHAKIHELVRLAQEGEEEVNAKSKTTGSYGDHTTPDPDFIVQ